MRDQRFITDFKVHEVADTVSSRANFIWVVPSQAICQTGSLNWMLNQGLYSLPLPQ